MSEGSDQSIYTVQDEEMAAFYVGVEQPELTPREQSFIGALANHRALTAEELDSSIPFTTEDDHEINEPWRTSACLGHLVARGAVVRVDNSYQLPVQGE